MNLETDLIARVHALEAQLVRKQGNTIRTFAVICVAVTTLFIMGMRIWDEILFGQTDWCSRALGAAKYATGRPAAAVNQCFLLQQQQISTMGGWGYIDAVTPALCLLVLVVIVIAGGKLSFRGSVKDGVEVDVGRESVDAAKRVEAAATDERKQIEQEAAAAPTPAPASKPELPLDGFEEATE